MNRVETSNRGQSIRLAIECAALFAGVPVAYTTGWIPVTILPLLLLTAAGCAWARRRHQPGLGDLLRQKVAGREWRRVLIQYAAVLPVLAGLLWLTKPAALFSLVTRHPSIWLLVMAAYPMVSVFPQEVIYRGFFFERYRPLFGPGLGLVAADVAAFGLGHIVFHNWPTVVLTFLGGWLFAITYRRTSSLTLVAVEHALYACAIFTIGYGTYFYEGTLRWFRP